jgi:hypothetical protein
MQHAAHLIGWLVERLNEGWYVFAHVNKYYINGTWWYSKQDFLHDCLLVGCDPACRVFNVAIYLRTGEFDVIDVPFSCLTMGMLFRGSKMFLGASFCLTPVAFAVRPRSQLAFRFNRRAAVINMAAYLNSSAPDHEILARDKPEYTGDWTMALGYPKDNLHYGLAAFVSTISSIRSTLLEGKLVDARDTRALWEHKAILCSNVGIWGASLPVEAVEQFGQLSQEVMRWAHQLHWMCLTYNHDPAHDHRRLLAHLELFAPIFETERQMLSIVLDALRSPV